MLFGVFMSDRARLNERKEQLIYEYTSQNKKALRGRKMIFYSLWAIFVLRLFLALFEIPAFLILHKPINLISVLFIIPIFFILRLIYNGSKGLAYLFLVFTTLRLIAYFAAAYPTLPDIPMRNVYSFVLFGILMLQFFIALLILVNFDCDTYFNAAQRISLRIKTEADAEKISEIADDEENFS